MTATCFEEQRFQCFQVFDQLVCEVSQRVLDLTLTPSAGLSAGQHPDTLSTEGWSESFGTMWSAHVSSWSMRRSAEVPFTVLEAKVLRPSPRPGWVITAGNVGGRGGVEVGGSRFRSSGVSASTEGVVGQKRCSCHSSWIVIDSFCTT